MKILTAEKLRETDAYTIKHEPVASIDLMERAALACVDWISRNLSGHHRFAVYCGTGNNGGDGLAIARMLYEKGNVVEVFIVKYSDKSSADFLANEKRLGEFPGIRVRTIAKEDAIAGEAVGSPYIIIDALFGTGLSRPAEGLAAAVIRHINKSGQKV